jgi:hypothetical protein
MTSFETFKTTFANLVPDMTRMAKAAFRDRDPEAREEAVQNTLALAWKSYHALIQQGRGDEPGIIKSVLWYSIKQTRTGRTMPGSGDVKPKDCFTYAKRGRVTFESVALSSFVADDTPVPDAVSFRIDVPAFLATLNDRQQRMASDLMTGTTTTECAEKFKVTPGAVSQFRTRFKELFEVYIAG